MLINFENWNILFFSFYSVCVYVQYFSHLKNIFLSYNISRPKPPLSQLLPVPSLSSRSTSPFPFKKKKKSMAPKNINQIGLNKMQKD